MMYMVAREVFTFERLKETDEGFSLAAVDQVARGGFANERLKVKSGNLKKPGKLLW